MLSEKRICPDCGKEVGILQSGQLRVHGPRDDRCRGGARPKPKGVEEKALRYIEEGRVRVVEVARSRAVVEIQGSQPEPYVCRFNGLQWVCDCEARVDRCAHAVASALVTKVSPTVRLGESSDLDGLFELRFAPYDPLVAQ